MSTNGIYYRFLQRPSFISRGKIMWIILVLLQLVFACNFARASGGRAQQPRTETACEGERLSLRCLGNDLIQIQTAMYGRSDDRICSSDSSLNFDLHCGLHDTTSNVSKRCNDKSECVFTIGSDTFTDPCPTTNKYLQVLWECVPFAVGCPGEVSGLGKRKHYSTSLEENAAWVRDPFQQTDKIYFKALTRYANPRLYEFADLDAMAKNRASTFHTLADRIDGTGFVVYDGNVYYNKERSRIIGKYNLQQRRVTAETELPKANYHGTSPYGVGKDTDIDLAIDESGLWAIYATEANKGNIVLSRLERHTLNILNTWQTTQPKLSALNAFIVCGVLYVVNYETLIIDYKFNTTSNTEEKLEIVVPDISSDTSAIEYNPKDRLLYVWEAGSAVTYQVNFKPPEDLRPPTTTTSTVASISTTTKTRVQTSTSSPALSKPTTSTPFATATPNVFCTGREANGITWKDTQFSKMAVMNCPGIGGGQAIWICGGNSSGPAWQTNEPDLSQCSSQWIKDLIRKVKAASANPSNLSQLLLQKLREKEKQLTSWDIKMIISFYRLLLARALSEPRHAATLTDSVVKTSSLLLSKNVERVWRALGPSIQTQLAAALSSLVEDVAFFLGRDVTMDDGATTAKPSRSAEDYSDMSGLDWVESHVSLGIRVLSSQATVGRSREHVIRWKNSNGDTISVQSKAVLEALQLGTEKFTVVLLSFERLGTFMQEPSAYPDNTFTVNSQIVSVSVGSLKDKGFSRVEHPLQLKRPVSITFQHREESVHVACAYWSEKESSSSSVWSRRGCRRRAGNLSLSVCECEHMTNFVVLSSSYPFVGEDQWLTTTSPSPSPFSTRYISLVRSGVVICLVFSLAVAITLSFYSKKMDLNTIHKNIAITLCISEAVFLCGIQNNASTTACLVVAVLLHYSVLCVFTWSTMEAYHLLLLLGDPIERNDRWRWYYVIGYTCPGIAVGISSAVKYSKPGGNFECWLNSDDGALWGFIAPCCLLICLCVVFLGVMVKKLNSHQISSSDKKRIMRSRAAGTSILLLLLCAAWSCGVMWFSDVASQFTSILFCVFCAGYGIVSFIFRCLLPSQVRKMYSKCIPGRSKPPARSYQFNFGGLSAADQMSGESSTMHTNVRPDGTARTIYKYQSGATVTATTTMVPVANAHSMRLAKAAAMMDPTESLPLCHHNDDMSPDLIHHHASTRSRCARESSECTCLLGQAVDDTDPKLPPQHVAQLRHAMWNDYYQPHSTTGSHHRNELVEGQFGSDERFSSQQYEPPTHYCHCTQLSGASSGCYDHLHEDPGVRSRKQSHCQTCCCRSQNRLPPGRAPHHYETMGPFLPDPQPSQNSNSFQGCPSAMQRRHCYEDVSMHRVDMATSGNGGPQLRNNQSTCLNHDHQTQNREILATGSADSSFDRSASPHILPPTGHCPAYRSDPSACRRADKVSRSGRHSDPLSTDQGYDTDSQQPLIIPKQKSNVSPKPHFTSLTVTNAMNASHASLSDCHRNSYAAGAMMRNSSGSVASDCHSENDREVELIINASSGGNLDSAGLGGSSSDILPNPSDSLNANEYCGALGDSYADGIDTATGGCLNAYDTAASWSAVAASDPRLSNSHQTSRHVAQNSTKQTASKWLKPDTTTVQPNDENNSQVLKKGDPLSYTLPGTAQAGTKARIDLRSGGISMITNL